MNKKLCKIISILTAMILTATAGEATALAQTEAQTTTEAVTFAEIADYESETENDEPEAITQKDESTASAEETTANKTDEPIDEIADESSVFYTAQTAKSNDSSITKLSFSVGTSCGLGLNETSPLFVKDQDGNTVKTGLTYSTSDKNIVAIDTNGAVTGKKLGTATVYATASNGVKASLKITVSKAPDSITLNVTSAKIGIDEKSVDLNSTTINGYSKARIYTTSNAEVATVDANGVITGVSEGTATITCTTYNNKKAVCSVTVGKKPTSITITSKNATVQKGTNIHKVTYALSPGAYSYKTTISIKDKSIADINSNGYITAKKCGKTTVTIKTYNNLTATQEITVIDDSLSLNRNSTQLALSLSNVQKVKYGTSVQGRNLEGFIITNGENAVNEACQINTNSSVNIRSGAGTNYSVVATLKNGAAVTRIEKGVKKANGFTWDKIRFDGGTTGYVATNYIKLIQDNTKTLFIDFSVHGFEDEYYRDGQVLVNEANALIKYFAYHPSELGKCRLVIVPCANPDGAIAGTNNQRACSTAFGRCTANHIDMNRDFGSFRAAESRYLRDFIVESKPSVYLNMHGWLDETIGDTQLNSIINRQLGLSDRIDRYPTQQGYVIHWVHNNLGIPATLVEYKSSSSVSTDKDINMIKAIIDAKFNEPDMTLVESLTPAANGFTVNWGRTSDTTGYQVQYATRSDFANAATNYAGPKSSSSKTITGRAANTKYYVRIRTYKNINGSYVWGQWSPAKAVTTPAKPNTASINTVQAENRGFTVSWGRVSDTTGYQVQYATRSDFANAATNYAGPRDTTSKTVLGRAANTRYYVRIRTYKNINGSYVWGNWSPAVAVVTK